ncbi:MAG: hypothetical protein K2O47_07220 [Muribaculaceae bacterium]|nr:hypothetical protein [Muribaculaceae bacterium]
MEYTLTLQSQEDYRLIKKLLKAFDGASITPVRKRKSGIEISLEEARQGKVAGPFYKVEDLMKDLLD